MSRTLDQKRAAFCMGKIKSLAPHLLDDYCALVKGFSSTVLMNGLGQALAMLLAKNRHQEIALYNYLETWLCEECPSKPYDKSATAPYLLEAIVLNDQQHYVHAQAETHALMEWMKKLALAHQTLVRATEKVGEGDA